MTLEEFSKGLSEIYSLNEKDILLGRVSDKDLGDLLKSVCEAKNKGRFYFPDPLYDSHQKRIQKAKIRKSIIKFTETAQSRDLVLYKYREFLPKTAKDSVYSPNTVKKARTRDIQLFGDSPRRMRLERSGGRNGDFHLQGIVALPKGEYPQENYQKLDYQDMEIGVRQWEAYLSKPADGRLERDKQGKLIDSFEVALLGFADWYKQSMKNRRNGHERNPRTNWRVNN